jgi:hypothetical protein
LGDARRWQLVVEEIGGEGQGVESTGGGSRRADTNR